MKFMVLCMLELGHVPSPHTVLEGLAGIGFSPVESTTGAEGMQFGPRDSVLGQFRASDPEVLAHQLRVDIATRLHRMHVRAEFKLFVQPLESADDGVAGLLRAHGR